MKPISMQEYFDRAYKGVIAQGKGAYDSLEGTCVYLTKDGAKCNVGQLIPKSKYRKKLEPLTPYSLVEEKIIPGVKTTNFLRESSFLKSLQDAHDQSCFSGSTRLSGAAFISKYKNWMKALAHKYNLNTKVMQ